MHRLKKQSYEADRNQSTRCWHGKHHRNYNVSLYWTSVNIKPPPHWSMHTIFPLNTELSCPCQLLTNHQWPRTSTDRNLASPAAVRAADTVLRTPSKKITWMTGVHQGVSVRGQVQTHDVSIGRAPWLLAGVSWRASSGQTSQHSHTNTHI